MHMEDVWGEPRYLRKIPIYPVRMKDYEKFNKYVTSLNIPKNTINDPQILQMTYLKFLLVMAQLDDGFVKVVDYFVELMKLVLRAETINFFENENGRIIMNVDDKYEIRETDIEKVKKIISEQNLIELEDDTYLNPEFRQKLLEAKEFRAKKNKDSAPLDQKIFIYRCFSGESYENIKNLTIYQFTNEMKRYSHMKFSDVVQSAYYGGNREFKEGAKLPEWLDAIKDAQDDLVIDAKGFTSKIQKDFSTDK